MMTTILHQKNTVFIYLALCFLLGVAFRSFVHVASVFALLCIVICGSISLVSYIQKNKKSAILFLGVVLFCIGVVRYNTTLRPPEPLLFSLLNQQVTFEGIVVTPPDKRESSQRFVVETQVLQFSNAKQSLPPYQYLKENYPVLIAEKKSIVSISKTKILVSVELFPEIRVGDRLVFTGKLQEPMPFTTDAGKEFDYKSYLAKDNIFYSVSFARVESVTPPQTFHILRTISSIKELFVGSLNKILKPPDGALASGILLGVKQSLGDDLENAFIKTGLIHIVVLSGYNIGIIIVCMMWLGKNVFHLGKRSLIVVTAGMMGLFMVMVGLGASIVRAGVMMGLALGAQFFGREIDVTRILVFAAVGIVLISPRVLMFDISFQLSFLATIGIIYATPLFEKWLSFVPTRFGIRSIIGATLGTQMLVFPFLLWRIGTLSIIAPITNIIVLPFIPLAMLSSFISGFFGLIFVPLGRILGIVTHFILTPIVAFVEWSAQLSFSSISIQSFPLWLVIILYGAIGFLLMRYNRKYGSEK
jgi:competence protein ComEC